MIIMAFWTGEIIGIFFNETLVEEHARHMGLDRRDYLMYKITGEVL